MTPYRNPSVQAPGNLLSTLILVTALVVTPCFAFPAEAKPDLDALTRSAWDHFYSLEYDQAIQQFETVLNARPDDPGAINHLLDAVLYRELYKYDALDTRLYMKQGFTTGKPVPLDPMSKKRIRDLSERALSASEKRLRSDPKDAKALYARGTTEGIRATYLVLVEKSWFAGLRSALAARHDQEEALKLRPDLVDAKTLVGAHNYVVGSLTLPVKAMAGIAGIHGDKKKGLEMLAEAGRAGGETSTDARVALALFLRRDQQFQQALEVVRTLTRDHPRNFLFALEEGYILRDEGKNAEAASSFRTLLNGCKEGKYPNARLEVAQLALADALQALGQLPEAYQNYHAASTASGANPDVRQRALLGAGEVSDLLAKRDEAVVQYRAAIALDGASEEADQARRYLDKPYRGH
jgi:tetratricopeptide (TPR) repeat protein